ncbi:MAG: hypothetical protein WC101_02920 [Candidatus Gracilibacteria bacterium]
MNTVPGQIGSNEHQPDKADLRIEHFLRSLEPIRQEIGTSVDKMVRKFESLPDRVAQMRTEVPNGDNLSLRDLVVTHTMMTPEERERAKIKNLQSKTAQSLHGIAPEIS